MRKLMLLSMMVGLLAGLWVVPAAAQDGGSLVLGETVMGELSAEAPEMTYTFEGEAGQVVQIQMVVDWESMLDPSLVLLGPDGMELAANDDFSGLDAMIVMELPTAGTYSVVAMRSDYSLDDESWGAYSLSMDLVEKLEPGMTVTSTVLSDYELDEPTVYIVMVDEATTWAISYSQPGGELSGSIEMMTVEDQTYLFELSEASGSRSGTINVDLEPGVLYIIKVEQSLFSFSWDVESIEFSLSVAVAE